MKDWNLRRLPEMFTEDSGGLSIIEWGVLIGMCILVFVMIGMILGNAFFRRCRVAVMEFHEENERGIVRVENYRATIDKQLRSEQRLERNHH